MFINCRHCHALVATDPATDLPPERCPRCRGVLRRPHAPAGGDARVPGEDAAAAATPLDAPPTQPPAPPDAAEHEAGDPQVDDDPASTPTPTLQTVPDAPPPAPGEVPVAGHPAARTAP